MESERLRLLGTKHLKTFTPKKMVASFRAISLTKKVVFFGLLFCGGFALNLTALMWSIYEQYLIENLEMHVSTIAMEDQDLISFVQTQFLVPPPAAKTALNLSNHNLDDIFLGQSERIQGFIGNISNGFFVEARARDGESMTNTLALEQKYNWTGLLVEPDPLIYQQLSLKHRRAYLSRSCVSRKPYPTLNSLPQKTKLEQLATTLKLPSTSTDINRVQCFPLYTYLAALGRTTVDYLSLNIYGGELEVLQNVPWDKVNIRVVSVKHAMRINPGNTPLFSNVMVPSSKRVLDIYMGRKGYSVHSEEKHFMAIRPTVTVFVKY